MKKIILTGGGTAGHVTPNLALLPALKTENFEISYIGRYKGIEKELIEKENISYFGISSGKFRREFNIKNISDIFRIIKGLGEAFFLLRRLKPDIIFSKGGFVTVPVVAAARILGIKAIIHESDLSPGLANRLSLPFANKICLSFPETLSYIKGSKGILTGTPVRADLLNGNKDEGFRICKFNENKPTVLFTGGSLGAAAINRCLQAALPLLCQNYNIIHLCGKDNLSGIQYNGYAEFEYAENELPHLFALAELAVSRAGANTLFELLALKKPHLLIPLTKKASRGDQLQNAESFKNQGFSMILAEEEMNADSLSACVDELYKTKDDYIKKMENHSLANGIANIMDALREALA